MRSLLSHLDGKAHVIWDWNGTLLDDVDLAVAAIGEVLQAHGLPPIDRTTYRNTFCFPIPEYYRRLGFTFDEATFDALTQQFVSCYRKRKGLLKLHEGTKEVLQAVRDRRHTQSVLSAAHEQDLRTLLDHFAIGHLFDHVYGLSDHYAVSKIQRGRQLLDQSGVDAAKTVLIGDTDHDWEVGQSLGIEVILLGDGHQHVDRLKHLKARIVASR